MELLLNCHLATFCTVCDFKKWPNDNLITVTCVFDLVLLYIAIVSYKYSMGNTASTWPQLDISPCSYHLFLYIDHGNYTQSTWL